MIYIKWFIIIAVALAVLLVEWGILDLPANELTHVGRRVCQVVPLVALLLFTVWLLRVPDWLLWLFIFRL